jgi:hypothetical protein
VQRNVGERVREVRADEPIGVREALARGEVGAIVEDRHLEAEQGAHVRHGLRDVSGAHDDELLHGPSHLQVELRGLAVHLDLPQAVAGPGIGECSLDQLEGRGVQCFRAEPAVHHRSAAGAGDHDGDPAADGGVHGPTDDDHGGGAPSSLRGRQEQLGHVGRAQRHACPSRPEITAS